jgi:hypothetical protein
LSHFWLERSLGSDHITRKHFAQAACSTARSPNPLGGTRHVLEDVTWSLTNLHISYTHMLAGAVPGAGTKKKPIYTNTYIFIHTQICIYIYIYICIYIYIDICIRHRASGTQQREVFPRLPLLAGKITWLRSHRKKTLRADSLFHRTVTQPPRWNKGCARRWPLLLFEMRIKGRAQR